MKARTFFRCPSGLLSHGQYSSTRSFNHYTVLRWIFVGYSRISQALPPSLPLSTQPTSCLIKHKRRWDSRRRNAVVYQSPNNANVCKQILQNQSVSWNLQSLPTMLSPQRFRRQWCPPRTLLSFPNPCHIPQPCRVEVLLVQ